jgi:acetyl-CoA synthetase
MHPTDGQIIPVKPEIAAKAHITAPRYQEMFERAARDPDGFWSEQSRRIAWMKAPTRIKNTSFAGDVSIKWFEDGTLNASAACLDRHLATHGDKTAIIWESDDPSVSKHVTYRAAIRPRSGTALQLGRRRANAKGVPHVAFDEQIQ